MNVFDKSPENGLLVYYICIQTNIVGPMHLFHGFTNCEEIFENKLRFDAKTVGKSLYDRRDTLTVLPTEF